MLNYQRVKLTAVPSCLSSKELLGKEPFTGTGQHHRDGLGLPTQVLRDSNMAWKIHL